MVSMESSSRSANVTSFQDVLTGIYRKENQECSFYIQKRPFSRVSHLRKPKGLRQVVVCSLSYYRLCKEIVSMIPKNI